MATHFQPWETDAEYGTRYVFERAGDGIAMHAHAVESAYHDIRCIKGSVGVYGDGLDVIVRAGEVFTDFKCYRMHEIAALEDGTEIINTFTHGNQNGYRGVNLEGLSGSGTAVLTGKNYYS
jgi:hypothetical protein